MADAPDADDPLAAVREHVRNAQRAAERLAREAGAPPSPAPGVEAPSTRPSAGDPTPSSGWEAEPERTSGELQTLAELLGSLRSLLPDELREQLNELIRQVLLLIRAVIDWLVARLEREGRGREVTVEDIPIG